MAIVPEALKVNPGIGKVLKKKYELLMASEIRVSL
jgi:hypothetical protein